MDTPDPEGMSLLAKVVAAFVALVAPVWGARTWLEKRFDKKAEKLDVADSFQSVQNELGIHRGYFKDVFNQLREDRTAAEERHRELMMHLLEKKQ